jgi:hypothetical protein
VTAWSLPLVFNVEAVASPSVAEGRFEPAQEARILPGEMRGVEGAVAFLVPWGSQAAGRLLAAALRQDLRASTSDKPFAQNGTRFPSGTLIFKARENPPDLADRLAKLARETGADVYGTASGWVDEGVNFGSRQVFPVRKPAILMAWDAPSTPGSAGAARFVLERQFGYPVTVARTAQLTSAELGRFNVLVLSSGSGHAQLLGDSGIARLKTWVETGGTVVAIGEAVNFLADKKVGLLAIAQEEAFREPDPAKKAEKPEERTPGTVIANDASYAKAIQAEREPPDSAPGALVRARILGDHWLTAGMGDSVIAMMQGRSIYTPLKIDKGVNAAYFEAPEKLLAAGYLWAENRKQLAYKPLVVVQPVGRGFAIGFTADPNFRAIMDGLNVLLLNAVFRGPAHARP